MPVDKQNHVGYTPIHLGTARFTHFTNNLRLTPFLPFGDPQWDPAPLWVVHEWPKREAQVYIMIHHQVFTEFIIRSNCPLWIKVQCSIIMTTTNCSTSCLLISLVEYVLFWWTSRLSDHSVLFLRLVGVWATALLQDFWDMLGDLPSLRKDMDWFGGGRGRLLENI